jgi:hypothetical protein
LAVTLSQLEGMGMKVHTATGSETALRAWPAGIAAEAPQPKRASRPEAAGPRTVPDVVALAWRIRLVKLHPTAAGKSTVFGQTTGQPPEACSIHRLRRHVPAISRVMAHVDPLQGVASRRGH